MSVRVLYAQELCVIKQEASPHHPVCRSLWINVVSAHALARNLGLPQVGENVPPGPVTFAVHHYWTPMLAC